MRCEQTRGQSGEAGKEEATRAGACFQVSSQGREEVGSTKLWGKPRHDRLWLPIFTRVAGNSEITEERHWISQDDGQIPDGFDYFAFEQ